MRFTDREAGILGALSEAVLPPGRILPGAGPSVFERLESFFSTVAPSIGRAYSASLWALELRTLARFGARFSALPLGRRLKALAAYERSEASRLVIRGLLMPLKMAYFADPKIYDAIGCRFAVEPPKALERPRWRDRVVQATSFASGETLECDAVIVGTGAGGAPIAKKLAERGWAVLLVEEGEHYTRADFTGRALEMMRKTYRNAALTIAFGNTAIPIPVGMAVGGSTLVNSGTCLRAPAATLTRWEEELGLAELSGDALVPYYEEAERFLEVAPSSKRALGKPADVIARGCDALGYSHLALRRNAPGCDGQGLCCFGCPTDAKRSTNVSWIPSALERGAQLITGLKVERVLVDGETAIGVDGVARSRDGGEVRISVRARVVVLACGTLYTPLVLLGSGLANGSGQVGRHLTIHPAASAIGLFDEELNAWNTVPQGYAIDEFVDEGLLFEGAQAPLDVTATYLLSYGPAYVSLMEKYNRTMGFGFMISDSSRGRVSAGPGGDPLVTYWLNGQDLAKMRRGFGILARVFFAAGAKEVRPAVARHDRLRSLADVEAFERASISPRHIDITAYHPLGTCQMGKDALSSVVDATHETHDVHNLFVCDGSAIPGPLGVNPQLTIMAMSLRASEFVARRLERLS
jgi:choline dehydrogenase-like flavoprotein